jgi:chromosome segregation ATPase
LIQSILFFTLGFLTAGFLALMVAPAIWRRAVLLTRKRIEASVPLTMNEIQADKDQLRAEFAMSTRRLEMSIKTFRDKASAQIIEINRNREELKRLAEERAEKDRAITELEARASELHTELRNREEQLKRLSTRLADTDRILESKALEIDRLGQMYDEASLTASNRQIELVTRESQFERVSSDVEALRAQRRDAEKRLREAVAESKAAQEALKMERKRAADAERKVERLLGTVADREEKLERREKEMARLREQSKSSARSSNELDTRLLEAQTDRMKLEAELADLQLQMSTLLSGATGGDVEKAMASLNKDRAKLEERMTTLVRENKKLKAELTAIERAKTDDWSDERRDSAILREQINDLAAEVVNLTVLLDGPDSPINQILSKGDDARRPEGADRIVSLADRVRALQKAASAG